MQPLMNMITFTARNRETIIRLHSKIANHLDNKEAEKVEAVLVTLSDYTKTLAYDVIAAKQKQKDG
jgi:hypothetical protein